MFWSVVLPFFVTFGSLLIAVLVATVSAPRLGMKRLRVFGWSVLLAAFAFIPSCTVTMWTANVLRLGVGHYENIDAIWDKRFKRWLPDDATDIVLNKHIGGYDARFHIDRKSLDAWFDHIWETAKEKAVPRTEPTIDRSFDPIEMDQRFGTFADAHPRVGATWIRYQGPERLNWAGATTWYDEKSGTAYQDVGFW